MRQAVRSKELRATKVKPKSFSLMGMLKMSSEKNRRAKAYWGASKQGL